MAISLFRNAAGVAFYEHLADHPKSKEVMVHWVKPEIYSNIRVLFEQRIDSNERDLLDSMYGIQPAKRDFAQRLLHI